MMNTQNTHKKGSVRQKHGSYCPVHGPQTMINSAPSYIDRNGEEYSLCITMVDGSRCGRRITDKPASVESEAAHTPKLWKEQSFLHFPERAFIVEALNNIERVTAQRDALLAAAKALLNDWGMESLADRHEKAIRAAIAKCEEGK